MRGRQRGIASVAARAVDIGWRQQRLPLGPRSGDDARGSPHGIRANAVGTNALDSNRAFEIVLANIHGRVKGGCILGLGILDIFHERAIRALGEVDLGPPAVIRLQRGEEDAVPVAGLHVRLLPELARRVLEDELRPVVWVGLAGRDREVVASRRQLARVFRLEVEAAERGDLCFAHKTKPLAATHLHCPPFFVFSLGKVPSKRVSTHDEDLYPAIPGLAGEGDHGVIEAACFNLPVGLYEVLLARQPFDAAGQPFFN